MRASMKTAKIFVLALTLATGVGGGAAMAAPANEIITAYYSDATYTTQVGEFTLACNNRHQLTGTRTEFSQIVSVTPC